MGSVHHLPTAAGSHARLLEQLVCKTIESHPDSKVAEAWAAMARQSIKRYAHPPVPSQPVLDLDSIKGLSTEQMNQVHELTKSWLEHYLVDVRNQLMNVHRDLLALQKRVAEHEADYKPDTDPKPEY